MGAEPLHSRDTSAFGRPSISRAHCSEGETGAPKPPSQSHATKEERSRDLSRLPVTAPPAPQPSAGPLDHTIWPRPWGPTAVPTRTLSAPRIPRAPVPAPSRATHHALLLQPKQRPGPACHVSCSSPRLDCAPSGGQIRSAPPEPSTVKERSPLPVTPMRSPRLTKAACTHSGLVGRKGQREDPRASKLQFLWGRCQPQLFGAHCIPGTC